jgi:Predicted transcriptional regulators
VLTALGFNGSETKILEVLFRTGPSTVNDISKNAEIDRAETYRLVMKLQEKGYLQKVYDYPMRIKAVPMCDLLSLQIQKRKKEIAVLEEEAKRMITLESNCIRPLEREYIILLPQAEKAVEEIRREVKEVENSIHIVTSFSNYLTAQQMPWGKVWEPLLKRGVKITQIFNEPVQKEKIIDCCCQEIQCTNKVGLSRYSNYSIRHITQIDDFQPKIEFVIHDNKKVWIKTSGDSYDKSKWIFSNNPRLIALTRYTFEEMLLNSKSV